MKNLLFVAFCLLSFSLQAQLNTATSLSLSAEPKGSPNMAWEQNTHDFGSLSMGDEATYTFVVKNTGDADLFLRSVKPSCSCTVTEYTKTAIAPGQSGFVTASYSTKKAGVFAKTITVQTNIDGGPILLKLRGEVSNDEM